MINEALRLLRLYCGLSQAELASDLGVSQSLISDIESSRKSVSLDLIEKYSATFNIRMSQLLFFAEEIDGVPLKSRGKLIIAEKVLSILERIKPHENPKGSHI